MGMSMALVTSGTGMDDGSIYEGLLLTRRSREVSRESRRARSRCRFNSRCWGVNEYLGGLEQRELDILGEVRLGSDAESRDVKSGLR